MSDTKDGNIEIVKMWANKIATEDNEMIYLRKKNGILYFTKAEPHTTNKWSRLDPEDEPVFTDVHGKTLEEKLGTDVQDIVIKEESKPIPNIPEGWYQDERANLYRYLGTGIWDHAPMKDWGKLLISAESGTLEYLG